MPITREPKPLPSPLDYVPSNGEEYYVNGDDNWDSLVQLPEMKGVNISASDLCYFNFKTRDAAEINWYLYHKVGCRHTTRDTLNYVFSLADKPGIVYLPKAGVVQPHQKIPGKRSSADQLMIYATGEDAFEKLAEDFEKESPGNNRTEVANDATQLRSILNRYENLKQINFYTHGSIGSMYLPGGSVSMSNLSSLSAPHTNLFDGEGRVLFIGCNIGEGPKGREFLIAAGRKLLMTHGGIVGATTVKNIFGRWGLIDARMPMWGDLRLIRLDANGNVLAEKMY
jgi:hypothetical protein